MKRLLIVLILLSTLIPLTNAALPTGSQYGGVYYVNESLQFHTEAQICAHYGLTGIYGNMYYPIYQWVDNGAVVSQDDWANPGAPWTVTGTYLSPTYYVQEFAVCTGAVQKHWMYYNLSGGTRPTSANISFHVSETGNFTHKLPGVVVSSSSGASGSTDINGTVNITVTPAASTYTYTAIKDGYTIGTGSIGDVGALGGDIYLTLTPITMATNTTGISFWVHIYDPLKSAKIANSDLIVRNTTSFSSFRYISSTVGSFLIDSTYVSPKEPITAGQYVNLTGIAPGYQTGNAIVSIPYDGWEYNLNLVATADVPTGANATLIVQAIDLYTSAGIEGATITISNNTIPYSSSKLSNAGGSATFSSIPAGTYQITATKTGYQSSTTSWPAGASAVTSAYIGILPVGATPVVTGTAGNPLFDADGNPIVGYDANGNPITAAPTQDTRTAAEKDAGMMDLLRNNGEALIMLFIVFTIIYMIKGIGR